MTIPTDAGGNAIDYDSDIGWCPDCGDVELTVEVLADTGTAQALRYTCPACGFTYTWVDDAPELDEFLIPPYSS